SHMSTAVSWQTGINGHTFQGHEKEMQLVCKTAALLEMTARGLSSDEKIYNREKLCEASGCGCA
ncbi:mCG65732, partial [Mus musculus]